MIAVSGKPNTDGAFIKICLVKTVEILCPDKAEIFKDLALTRNRATNRDVCKFKGSNKNYFC